MSNFEIQSIVSDLIDETKDLSNVPYRSDIHEDLLVSPYPLPQKIVWLPQNTDCTNLEVEKALVKRAASRSWESSPVKLNDLGEILSSVYQQDKLNWKNEQQHQLDIEIIVYVTNVEGLEKGIYSYCSNNHVLNMICGVDNERMKKIVLQEEFSYSPVIILFIGKLGAALSKLGAVGHRRLLVRGGMMGQYAWLKSLDLGYKGTTFAGILQGPLYEDLKIDGYVRAQLFAFAFGW